MTQSEPPETPAAHLSEIARKVLGREPPVMRKRFYQKVDVVAAGAGFAIQLDGRALKTPRKLPLVLVNRTLAAAMAAEWAAQGIEILPASMQLTTLVFTALDAVAGQMPEVIAEIGRYALSDLLCYRADAPAELVARQAISWDPVLTWAEGVLGGSFNRTSGLMPVSQDKNLATAIEARLADGNALRLAATSVLTTLTGSAVLALAVRERHLSIDDAWRLAHIDEEWQREKWGTDADAAIRHATRWTTATAAATVLTLEDAPEPQP